MASASGYNHHRFARAVLKKSKKWEASLTIQLHSHFWRFGDSVSALWPLNTSARIQCWHMKR